VARRRGAVGGRGAAAGGAWGCDGREREREGRAPRPTRARGARPCRAGVVRCIGCDTVRTDVLVVILGTFDLDYTVSTIVPLVARLYPPSASAASRADARTPSMGGAFRMARPTRRLAAPVSNRLLSGPQAHPEAQSTVREVSLRQL
jgi:hypothetical protein